jgi:hypothetical protein
LVRRKYTLRRSASSRRRPLALVNRLHHPISNSHGSGASTPPSSTDTPRPVLVPLHPNLRRLPSRLLLAQKDVMRDTSRSLGVQAGTKRKRVASSNENAHASGRPTRGSGRLKRLRSASSQMYTSDEGETSSMEVDTHNSWVPSDYSDEEEDNVDSCQYESLFPNNSLIKQSLSRRTSD